MISKRYLAALALSLPLVSLAAESAPFKVGVVEHDFTPSEPYNWRGAESHTLTTTIWYPAARDAKEVPQNIGPQEKPFFVLGSAAPGARPAEKPRKFPLVLLSHGSGGASGQMAWLGRTLAAHGYVAAAVNHPGNNGRAPYTLEGFSLWRERASDLSTVLDAMLADPRFSKHIDSRRIGAAGFSIGGYTMVVLAGGISLPARLHDYCAGEGSKDKAQCDPQTPEFPNLATKIHVRAGEDAEYRHAFLDSKAERKDSRIRAFFAIAPALTASFDPASLKSITAPVSIVAGDADAIVPADNNARYLASQIPSSSLQLLPGVGHYAFLAECTEAGKQHIPVFCADPAGIDRGDIHARTADRALRFFNAKLH